MITEQITCHQCGKTAELRAAIGWLRIDYPPGAPDTTMFGQIPMPLDFCGWDCIWDRKARDSRLS